MSSIRTGVMLALQADERNLNRMPETVVFQRKYNGERCRVEWGEDGLKLMSSCGNTFPFFAKLKDEIVQFGLEGVCLDGELYCHGMSREEIHSICSRKNKRHEDEDKLTFMVFDVIYDTIKQYDRLKILSMPKETKFLKEVESYLDNKERLLYYADKFISEGYEGVIIRNPNSFYTPRKCSAMLKFKPNEQDEYLITGFKEEISIEGFGKNRLGAILVKDSDGTEFFVGSGSSLTSERRDYWWKNRDKLIGAIAIVKHSKIETVNKIPTCTSLIGIKIIGV